MDQSLRAGRWLPVATVVLAFMVLPASPARAVDAARGQFVLNGENNRLNAYDAVTRAKRTLIASAADSPSTGLDINAEICEVPDSVPWKPADETWFIAGEDTEQNTVAGVIRQGWGLFRLTGTHAGFA